VSKSKPFVVLQTHSIKHIIVS